MSCTGKNRNIELMQLHIYLWFSVSVYCISKLVRRVSKLLLVELGSKIKRE